MFSYVNSVLVPEAIVYLVMEFYNIGYTEVTIIYYTAYLVNCSNTLLIQAERKMREPYQETVEILSDEGSYFS